MFRAGLYPRGILIFEKITDPGLKHSEASRGKAVDGSHFSMRPVPKATYVVLRENQGSLLSGSELLRF